MKKILTGFFLVCSTFLFSQKRILKESSAASPTVTTSLGAVQGTSDGAVDAFKGIPYAEAPIGELRWRAPQPPKPWKGVRDASKFCADCAQAGWPSSTDQLRENTSEDCLFLNLWRPTGSTKDAKLPVMVWIYGGGFVGGGSSYATTSGDNFAKQGVILVSFNYRLGRLGHFAFPALSKDHPDEPKGSYAYMDQIAALKWIKKNIASFGGDPNNVTIFGESAGGVSVHSLLTIPAAQGFFQKAIIESGGGRDGVLTGRPIRAENADPYYPVSAETIGINFARIHGIEGTDAAALRKLRALSVEVIVDGGKESQNDSIMYSGPILDGKLVVETAESIYKNQRQPAIPIIIGSNSAEVPAGFVNAQSKEELFAKFAPYSEEARNTYDPDGTKSLAELLTMLNTDKVWAEPARFTARAFSGKGTDTYIYLFDYVQTALQQQFAYGAPHASEIPYVFNTLSGRNGMELTEKDRQVASMLNRYWANFAKTGNPNSDGIPKWEKFNEQNDNLLEIRRDGSATSTPDPKKTRLDIIEKVTKNLK
ncbi:MAG: carboxylesterase family protein [Chlorobi bacterium]|uniref:carboxylesterase/lipase family protein n=1 Tax=Sphingobacterium multivorum TaxID=28454 RepID=UPI00244FFF83|nr:carboxylesterase family protein [Sphingobacterium multivorum]NPA07805.1 carboxylesterase family protein [Chlorobiota bacterium]